MKREVYDRVERWRKRYPRKTMAEAFEACRVNGPTYYGQKRKVEAAAKSTTRRSEPTYEAELLPAVSPQPWGGASDVRPGMVAIVGAPEDVARMMLTIGGAK